jgi:hypothetical protein
MVLRFSLVLALAVVATGCGGDPSTADDDGDSGVDAGDGDLPVPVEGFQIRTPDVVIEAGQEITYCYYLRMPAATEVGVKRWQSRMTAGSHHMIVYFTPTEQQPEGTLSANGCGNLGGITNLPVWTYSAQSAEGSATMPAGVGMTVPAQQPAYIQMHYLNTGDEPITVHVTLNAETYAATETYTKAAAFVTFNTLIDLPPNGTGAASGTCPVPDDVSFFALSTHAHKQAVMTRVHDGEDLVFESDDWEHPAGRTWEAPFYRFTSGSLTYGCDYVNPTDRTIRTGPSAETDEMCMAIGYVCPATGSKMCINNAVVN